MRPLNLQISTKLGLIVLLLIALHVFSGCKKQIHPAITTSQTSYLVVQGNIVPGDSTVINISRTVKLYDSVNSRPELGAKVSIESSTGESFPLLSKNNGVYVSAPINLLPSATYRVKVVTSSGGQYASDYVAVKNSPVIDSIAAAPGSNGLSINVNTHDYANNTHYYRWEYTETYIIRTEYNSKFMVLNQDTVVPRPVSQQINQCWISDTSSTIVLGSSTKLAKDIITNQTILQLPPTSEKLHIRYSILVKQYALTTDAYNYFTLLKKNTEQLGSIFDAQPSSLTGNVHSLTNPSEPVIGYVTAGAVQQRRIFVDNAVLPASWSAILPYGTCQLDMLGYHVLISDGPPPLYENYVKDLIYTGIEIPVDEIDGGYSAAFPYCVDCTLRGVNKPPSFWQ